MPNTRKFWLLAIAAASLTLSGCRVSPSLNQVQALIQEELSPATFKTELKMTFGPISLGLTRGILSLTNIGEAEDYLEVVRKVELGVYEVRGLDDLAEVRIPQKLEQELAGHGWETIVKVRERDELAWILYHNDGYPTINSMFIIALEKKELVIVKIQGRLDELIEKALNNENLQVGPFIDIS